MSTHFTRRGLLKGASAIGAASVLGLPYSRSRDANPEDALSCHVLRLREGGLIKKAPNALITRGTDWRFLNEWKKELKA